MFHSLRMSLAAHYMAKTKQRHKSWVFCFSSLRANKPQESELLNLETVNRNAALETTYLPD